MYDTEDYWTEQQRLADEAMAELEIDMWFNKTERVECTCCGATATGTMAEMERRNWQVRGWTLCPSCFARRICPKVVTV